MSYWYLIGDNDFLKRTISHTEKVDDCWIFKGKKDAYGYGSKSVRMIVDGKKVRKYIKVHRAVWEIINGETELCVLHSCDNRACCRPDHLFVGTHGDNIRDMYSKGRANLKRPFGEDNKRSKYSNETILTIIKDYRDGVRRVDISKKYDMPSSSLSAIMLGYSWSKVTGIKPQKEI